MAVGAEPDGAATAAVPVDTVRSAFPDLVGLVLFGSRARGRMRAHSDVDLLLVLSPDEHLDRGLYERWDAALGNLDDRLAPHFARLPLDPLEVGGLWREVAHEGVVLWERDGAVSRAMQAIREHVRRAGDRRELLHGHPYWVRGR